MLPGKLAGGEGGGAAPHKPDRARRLGLPGSLAPEAAANAPPAPGGATAPSCGRLENSRARLREEDHDSQPQRALGRVWSQAWAHQAVTPGPEAEA